MTFFNTKGCDEIKLNLAAYVKHQPDEETIRVVDDHMASCADCRGFLALEQTLMSMDTAPIQAAPEDFADAVMMQWQTEPSESPTRLHRYNDTRRRQLSWSAYIVRQATATAVGRFRDVYAMVEIQTRESLRMMVLSTKWAVNRLGVSRR